MSEAVPAHEAAEETEREYRRYLLPGIAIAAGLVLILAFFLILLVIALRNDVASLDEHVRKEIKATRALQEELAAKVEAAEHARSGTSKASAQTAVPAAAHIDSVDTSGDCVIRPGSGRGLADCIGARAR